MRIRERNPQQLPPGRHGLPRDYVAENQRERILTALTQLVAEIGYAEMAVATVVTRAGVSRKTFYQHFSNKEDAFLAAYDTFAARVLEQIKQAQRSEGEFLRQAEAILRTVLELLADHHAEAYLMVVEVLTVSPKTIERRNTALRTVIDTVHRTTCALAAEQGTQPPTTITAETVVGGLVEVLYNRIQCGETSTLPELLPDLMYCALLPYVGPAAATAEHRRLAEG